MQILTGEQLRLLVSYDELIDSLSSAFTSGLITVPERHHHTIVRDDHEGTLLLMPAWQKDFIGVKQVTVFPENTKKHIPTIQGLYLLLDGIAGTPIMALDAKVLTNLRTAATSALAARQICGKDMKSMLMVGTGSLAPYLIEAHDQVHSFSTVSIWGRTPEKAHQMVVQVRGQCPNLDIKVCSDLQQGVKTSDLISVATMASHPIIRGEWLDPGQHLDLVGAYTPTMREADDDVIRRCEIYIDTETACKETGDLAIPIESGLLDPKDIRGTLADLCQDGAAGVSKAPTVFKSVGHASEDLVCAVLAFKKYIKSNLQTSRGTT